MSLDAGAVPGVLAGAVAGAAVALGAAACCSQAASGATITTTAATDSDGTQRYDAYTLPEGTAVHLARDMRTLERVSAAMLDVLEREVADAGVAVRGATFRTTQRWRGANGRVMQSKDTSRAGETPPFLDCGRNAAELQKSQRLRPERRSPRRAGGWDGHGVGGGAAGRAAPAGARADRAARPRPKPPPRCARRARRLGAELCGAAGPPSRGLCRLGGALRPPTFALRRPPCAAPPSMCAALHVLRRLPGVCRAASPLCCTASRAVLPPAGSTGRAGPPIGRDGRQADAGAARPRLSARPHPRRRRRRAASRL
eukprot:SAG11_NODE_3614_length_2337_cov_3.277033_2_plen_313_part_00